MLVAKVLAACVCFSLCEVAHVGILVWIRISCLEEKVERKGKWEREIR